MGSHRLLCTALLLVLPHGAAAQLTTGRSLPPAPSDALELRGGDAVRLLIQDERELSGEYPVLQDGTVLLPLIGQVVVSGRTFSEVRQAIQERYAKELVGLDVVVEPMIRVRVLGEVRLPGLYLIDATYALEDVIARAGGMLPTASGRDVELVRSGRTERLDLRNARVIMPMQSGDELIVPRRSWVSQNAPILVGAATSVLAAALTALIVR